MLENPVVPFNSLEETQDTQIRKSREKYVYQRRLGSKLVAAKIYRTFDDLGQRIDRQSASQVEFHAYSRFKRGPLGIYTPSPFSLLTDANEGIIGLAVEWKQGEGLDSFEGQKVLKRLEFEELKKAVQEQIMMGFYPAMDMLNTINLLFDSIGNNPRLAFAECIGTTETGASIDDPTFRYAFEEIEYFVQK